MNFSTLQTKVAGWLNRTDLTAQIPDFINTVLRDLELKHNFEYMRVITTGVTTDASGLFAIPTRYKETKALIAHYSGNSKGPLIKNPYDYLLNQFPDSSPDWPGGFGEYDQTYFGLRPIPPTGMTFTHIWYQKSADLSADADHNWITDNYPEILIFGACMEAAPYLVEDQRIPVWEKKYLDKLSDLIRSDKAKEFSGYQYVKPGVVV